MSSITNIVTQQFKVHDLQDAFPQILQMVNANLYELLHNEPDNIDIENTNITITYKIKHNIISKRNKLKFLGPYKKIKANETDKKCAICHENFEKGKYKREMPKCVHEFHKTCIDEWLYKDKKQSCPLCRQKQRNN